MENFLQKLQAKGNPTSSGGTVSPEAAAVLKLLQGSAPRTSVTTGAGNGDIRNPVGYTGTTGYNGDYGALLADQIRNALGNTGLYSQVTGSSYDQMSNSNNESDKIYNERKAETGGLASKELSNQKAGYGSSALNALGEKTLSGISEATNNITNSPQFKAANMWSQAYTNMKPTLTQLFDTSGKPLPDNKTIDAKQANNLIEAYGQAVTGGGLTQGLYDANGNLSKNVLTDLQKYSSYVLPKNITKSNMTVGVAHAMAKAAVQNAKAYSGQVKKNYDTTFNSPGGISEQVQQSSAGQLQLENIPAINSLKGAMSSFIY